MIFSKLPSLASLPFFRADDRLFRTEDGQTRPRLLAFNRPDAPNSAFETVPFEGRDIRLHYFEAGTPKPNQSPLFLIHGFASNAFQWNRVFDELADRHHVVAIDLPGHGYSDALPGDRYELTTAVPQILDEFLERKGMKDVTLVGSSLGGGISQMLAAENDRIRRILLFGSSGCTGKREPVAPFIDAVVLSGLLPLDRPPPFLFERLGALLTLWLYVHPSLATLTLHDVEEFARPYRGSVEKMRARVDLARRIRDLCVSAENQEEIIALQRSIKQPVLYVFSEADRAVPSSVPEATLRLVRNSRLLRIGAKDIPTAGHTLMSDTPDLARQIIEDVMEGTIDLTPATAGTTRFIRRDSGSGRYEYIG